MALTWTTSPAPLPAPRLPGVPGAHSQWHSRDTDLPVCQHGAAPADKHCPAWKPRSFLLSIFPEVGCARGCKRLKAGCVAEFSIPFYQTWMLIAAELARSLSFWVNARPLNWDNQNWDSGAGFRKAIKFLNKFLSLPRSQACGTMHVPVRDPVFLIAPRVPQGAEAIHCLQWGCSRGCGCLLSPISLQLRHLFRLRRSWCKMS